jgi:3-isopropylmalate/(R)-2-methylmalate dehydratase small subunit
MSLFDPFSSVVIKLPQKDIDTDLIIPAQFLTTTSKEGLGENVFANLKKIDPTFPELKGRILIAGKNFGCGSSREHAVWALKQAGIDVVISSEFADIFRGNAEKNGLLPVPLNEEVVQHFLNSSERLTIDLGQQMVCDEHEHEYHFEISEFSKKRLLEGISDLDYLLSFESKIKDFAQKRP